MSVTDSNQSSAISTESYLKLGLIGLGFLVLAGTFYLRNFRGFEHPEAMDAAQIGRNIANGKGFTTKLIRPAAIRDLAQVQAPGVVSEPDEVAGIKEVDLFAMPDTLHAPVHPYFLATLFSVLTSGEPLDPDIKGSYWPEQVAAFAGMLILALTALLLFVWTSRMFDERVAWLASTGYVVSVLAWQFAVSGLSITLGGFFILAMMAATHEALLRAEDGDERGIWIWSMVSAVALALAVNTRMSLFLLLIPYGFVMIAALRLRPVPAISAVVAALLLTMPMWISFYASTGSVAGTNGFALEVKARNLGDYGILGFRNLLGDADVNWIRELVTRVYLGAQNFMPGFFAMTGSCVLTVFAVVGILHPFRRFRAQWTRAFIFLCLLFALVGQSAWCARPEPWSDANNLFLILPGLAAVGAAFFYVMLDRLNSVPTLAKVWITVGVVVICALPLIFLIAKPPAAPVAYPPYYPLAISNYGQLVQEDEMAAADIPEAVAWYANRHCLLIPSERDEYIYLNDRKQAISLMMVTQRTTGQAFATLARGSAKEWSALAMAGKPAQNWPLAQVVKLPNLEYIIYSDVSLGLRSRPIIVDEHVTEDAEIE